MASVIRIRSRTRYLTIATKKPEDGYPRALTDLLALSLDDLGRDKEDQLRGGGIHVGMLEQVPQQRNAAQQRDLSDRDVVLRLNDAADHHCAAIGHQYLRGDLLRVQRRVQLRTSNPAEIRQGILQVKVQEHRIIC